MITSSLIPIKTLLHQRVLDLYWIDNSIESKRINQTYHSKVLAQLKQFLDSRTWIDKEYEPMFFDALFECLSSAELDKLGERLLLKNTYVAARFYQRMLDQYRDDPKGIHHWLLAELYLSSYLQKLTNASIRFVLMRVYLKFFAVLIAIDPTIIHRLFLIEKPGDFHDNEGYKAPYPLLLLMNHFDSNPAAHQPVLKIIAERAQFDCQYKKNDDNILKYALSNHMFRCLLEQGSVKIKEDVLFKRLSFLSKNKTKNKKEIRAVWNSLSCVMNEKLAIKGIKSSQPINRTELTLIRHVNNLHFSFYGYNEYGLVDNPFIHIFPMLLLTNNREFLTLDSYGYLCEFYVFKNIFENHFNEKKKDIDFLQIITNRAHCLFTPKEGEENLQQKYDLSLKELKFKLEHEVCSIIHSVDNLDEYTIQKEMKMTRPVFPIQTLFQQTKDLKIELHQLFLLLLAELRQVHHLDWMNVQARIRKEKNNSTICYTGFHTVPQVLLPLIGMYCYRSETNHQHLISQDTSLTSSRTRFHSLPGK